jgi:hypothetical protein
VERLWNGCGTVVERLWKGCGTVVERLWNGVQLAPPYHAALCLQIQLQRILNARNQGLTLVHFSPQRKRFSWDMGCV